MECNFLYYFVLCRCRLMYSKFFIYRVIICTIPLILMDIAFIYSMITGGYEGNLKAVHDTLRMYKNDDIRMYNFNCITDTIVEVITTCNTYTLLTVHLL